MNRGMTFVQDHVSGLHRHIGGVSLMTIDFQHPILLHILGHIENGRTHCVCVCWDGTTQQQKNKNNTKKPRRIPKAKHTREGRENEKV